MDEPKAEAVSLTELQRLREIDAFKTNFLNMAAHELHTPLTPLRIQMHLLLSGGLGALEPKQKHAIEVATRNVDRVSALVQEILDVARIQGNGLRFRVESFAITDVVAEVVDTFETTAQGIKVGLTGAAPANLLIKTDRGRVIQIVTNLVSNALKFTSKDGQINVLAREEGTNVIVEVKDTGLGMTEEQMARLFQPFVQVHDPMTVSSRGTGLGLYISRSLAQALGGSLTCRSDGPARGSTFTLTLPLALQRIPETVPAAFTPANEKTEEIARRIRELI